MHARSRASVISTFFGSNKQKKYLKETKCTPLDLNLNKLGGYLIPVAIYQDSASKRT